MKHLDDRTLSGILDGELSGEALWRAQQHLEKCASCRDALAALGAQDDALKPALSHDPGDEYFEGFAEKVTERIATGKSGLGAEAGHATRGPIRLPWWQRPGVVVAAGSAMAIIAGAGVVMIASRNAEMPGAARERQIAGRVEQAAPPIAAAPESAAPSSGIVTLSAQAESMARAPALDLAGPRAPAAGGRGAAASRLQKVDQLESGEERSTAIGTGPGFAPPPPAAQPDSAGKYRWVDLKRAAHGPLAEMKSGGRAAGEPTKQAAGAGAADLAAPPAVPAPAAPAPAREAGAVTQNEVVRRDESGRALCGVVRDNDGRPLKGVSISAIDVAGIATSDAAGHFCLDVRGGTHTLQFMAIGFHTARVVVPATYGAEISVTLSAVSALRGGMASPSQAKTQRLTEPAPLALGPPSAAGGAAESQETLASDEAALRAVPDSLREVVIAAEHLQSGAIALGRASALDAAAAAWERILPHMPPDRSEIETRGRLAECRFRAWQFGPDARRAERAMDALTSYIVRAPVGEKRNLAARWIDSIHSR